MWRANVRWSGSQVSLGVRGAFWPSAPVDKNAVMITATVRCHQTTARTGVLLALCPDPIRLFRRVRGDDSSLTTKHHRRLNESI